MTTVDVARDVMRAFVPSACPACGGRPQYDVDRRGGTGEVAITSACHRSFERLLITEESLTRANDYEGAHKIRAWARNLFKLDANPDVRELLHYNRGVTPEARP